MKKIFFTVISLLTILFTSCKDDTFDYGYVNFYVDPESTMYSNLNLGSRQWEYFEGGFRGVVVFRRSYSEFICFERSCTAKDCHERLEVDQTNNMILVCPKCDSKFICVDGSPVKNSKAKKLLYTYCTYFDGINLYVNNCN